MTDTALQLSAENKIKLQIVGDIQRRFQEDMERMRPFFVQTIEFHRRTQEAFIPFVNSIRAFQEAVRPTLQAIRISREAFTNMTQMVRPQRLLNSETFVLPPSRRYPSAEEVADVVVRKLEQRNQAKQQIEFDSNKRAISVPDWAQWEELRLDIKDTRSFDIFHKYQLLGNYDYEAIGLVRSNTERKVPDRQSEFLSLLALTSMPGNKFKPTVSAVANQLEISKSACYQIKRILSKKLRTAFGIQRDPFYPYDPEEGYKTRFKLRPESILRGDGELHASGCRLYDETTDYPGDD